MNYQFEQLVNLEQLRKLLDSHNGFSGMAYGLFDTDENNLLAVGWQDICTQFHREHPVSCARCRESDAYLKTHLNSEKGPCLEYRCKNGMLDVAMPVMVEDKHLATFFVGQFFYDDDLPDREFFIKQAVELGFEQEAYLAALDRVPVFSREHIHNNMLFLHNMVEVLAEIGVSKLRLVHEMEERERVEQALQTERGLFMDGPTVVFKWKAQEGWPIEYVSPNVAKQFGYTPNELISGKIPFAAIVYPDDLARVVTEVKSYIEQNTDSFEQVYRLVCADGTVRWIQDFTLIIRGQDGVITHFLGYVLDITERKQMEEALAAREREFRSLVENSPDTIVRYDLECRRIYANPAFERLTGKTLEVVLGTSLVDGSPIIDVIKYQNALQHAMESGEEVEHEYVWQSADGRTIISSSRMMPELGEDGKVVSVLAIGRDITDRKQVELQLKQALDFSTGIINTIPDILFEVDRGGTYLNVWTQNPDVLAVQKETLLGKTVYEVLSPENATVAMKAIAEANENGVSYNNSICIVQLNGESRWYEHSLAKKRGSTSADDSFIVLSRDITERKNAEERLQDMKNRLSTIFATMPDMVWMKDRDGIYLACNSAFEEFSGVAEADLIGKTDYDLMDAEQADCCRKSDRDAILVGGVCFSEEEVTYAVDDRRGLLEVRKVPVYGADGCLTGVLGIGRDITERKRMEDELQQQNIFQNSLFMGLQNADVNLLLAEEGRFTYCNNKRFGEPFGLSETDMAAGPEFIRFIHPDDRARVAEIYQRRSAGEQMPSNLEIGVQWANGERREVELVVSVMGYNPLKTLIICKDITERKRMEQVLFAREQEFHTLVENAPDPIFRYDRDCRRTYLNPAAQRLLQAPASELLGLAPQETPLRWPVAFYQEMISKVLKSGKETEFELTLKRADQEQDAYMHVRLAPEYDASGQVYGVLAIGRDITERKRMEDELQRKNSELERFTYTVSHDLKSPVITIKSFSGCIKNDLTSGRHDRVEKDLDRICAAADKMTLLLDDLLKLSRSGKVIDAPVPVNMTQLVKEVLKNLDGTLQESGAQIIVQPDLPTVQCDRQRMAEVLQNLVENAVKYRGDQPQPCIEIGLRQDGDQAVFFVQDNGPGIDPRYHENIFGLFNRLETKVPGTGIGLALVKRIIETHGGKVWVESDGQGNGSTFCFTVG